MIRPFEIKEKNDQADEVEGPEVPEQETNENEAHDELTSVTASSAPAIAPAEMSADEQAEGQAQAEPKEYVPYEPGPAFKKKYEAAEKQTKKDKMEQKRQTKAQQKGNTLLNFLGLKKRKQTKKDEGQK